METKPSHSEDPGFLVLDMLLRLHGIEVDAEQLQRHVGPGAVGMAEMLRCADAFDLQARCLTIDWPQLAAARLPGIAGLRGGGFLLVGRVNAEKAVVLAPHAARPSVMMRAALEAQWDGRLFVMRRRGGLSKLVLKLVRRFDVVRILRAVVAAVRRRRRTLVLKHAQLAAGVGSGAIIDFAERARKLQRVVGLRQADDDRRRWEEVAFLPAALEIVETPPSPVGRAIAFSIIAIFVVALGWACIGTVDIVAVAPGKFIPSDRTKTIQPFETGVVRAIRVRDGQRVKAGDVLIELDATMTAAELDHRKGDLTAARLDAARARAALAEGDDPLANFAPPDNAPPALVEMHRHFLSSQAAEQKAKLAAIDRQVAQKAAERATIQASIEKLKATMTPLQQRVEIREHLFNKELGSKLTYLSELQDLVGQRQEILVQQSRYAEADAAVAALAETRTKAIAEYRRSLFDDLEKAEQKAAGLAQDVIKAEQRTSLHTLTAPVDGVVQQLAVHTVGGVVTPAQPLMLVVPEDGPLEIEAMVSNRDIGFVQAGQDAAIKVDTFNFTRYGLLHGKVLSVSHDAITRDKPQDKAAERAPGAEASSSEPKGQELIYSARISADRTQMEVEDKRVRLSPGMAVSVEIKTGARRIISYLLSPLARYKHDSLRER